MKPITLKEQPSKGYVFNGAQVLVDGLRGGSNYKTGHWLGFQGKDLDATIDLKESTEIQKVSFNTNVVKGDWIMGAPPSTVKVLPDAWSRISKERIASKEKSRGLTQKRQGRIISPRDILRPGKGSPCRGYHQQQQTTKMARWCRKPRILVRR